MIPWFQYTTLYIGPIPIQVWGSFVALGMITSLIIIQKRAKSYEIQKNPAIDFFFYMVLFGVIGGRLFHVFFYEPLYFLYHPLDLFKVWQGGMSSFGGIIGSLLYFFYYVKKKKFDKSKILNYADLLAFSAIYGWIIGRVGCFMIHDHIGKLSSAFFSVQTPYGARFEMALLEIIGLLPLALFFVFIKNERTRNGFFAFTLLSYYCLLRIGLDFFRARDLAGADARFFGLTPAQYFAILILAIASVCWFKKNRGLSKID